MEELMMKLPAVALRGMTILPGMIAHFDVSREKSIRAVEESMMDEQHIFLVAQKDIVLRYKYIQNYYNSEADKEIIEAEKNILRRYTNDA